MPVLLWPHELDASSTDLQPEDDHFQFLLFTVALESKAVTTTPASSSVHGTCGLFTDVSLVRIDPASGLPSRAWVLALFKPNLSLVRDRKPEAGGWLSSSSAYLVSMREPELSLQDPCKKQGVGWGATQL